MRARRVGYSAGFDALMAQAMGISPNNRLELLTTSQNLLTTPVCRGSMCRKLQISPEIRFVLRVVGFVSFNRKQPRTTTNTRLQSQTICGNVPQLAPDLTESPAFPENKARDV